VRKHFEFENIEALRRQLGIDDVELRQAIRELRIGDIVKMSVATETPCAGQTLRVRITRIEGLAFRGKVATLPAGAARTPLRVGAAIAFTADHIHSIAK
jgi:hypothetical protein